MFRLRESLSLILIGLLPFHALLVTVLTKMILGPGHAPMAALAVWKEGLLAVILLLAVWEILKNGQTWRLDILDWLIVVLILLGVIASTLMHRSLGLFALGFKYDFLPLIAFCILRQVEWSERFRSVLLRVILGVAALLGIWGMITLFASPQFFTLLGYSDLHSLYVPGGPLAAFQQIGGGAVRRMQSAFSGPNQFGIWLLIPWSIALLSLLWQTHVFPRLTKRQSQIACAVILGLTGVCLFFSFSRSAWIGAIAILCAGIASSVPRGIRLSLIAGFVGLTFVLVMAVAVLFPQVIVRLASSRDHIARPLQALQMMATHPLGLGLGSAGPASNRVSDACVYLNAGDDASWATDRPNLCVFKGDTQMQPTNRACSCPLLPENWYLQIGLELGIAGLILFFTFLFLVARRLLDTFRFSLLQGSALLLLFGISIAALFLHAWEDSAVAITGWVMVGIALGKGLGQGQGMKE